MPGSMTKRRSIWAYLSQSILVACGWMVITTTVTHAQGVAALDSIIQAHGSQVLPLVSVRMTGSVQRDKKNPEPFTLIATRDEKVRKEYGNEGKDTVVSSTTLNFRDDGQKFEFSRIPTDYSQLDTALFFLQELRQRAVRIEATTDRASVGGVVGQKIRIESERSQKHLGKILVKDEADLYVMD